MIAGLVAAVLVPGLLWLQDWQQQISNKLDAATGLSQVRDDNREPAHQAKNKVRDDNRAPVQTD